jgi:hypothetical protein
MNNCAACARALLAVQHSDSHMRRLARSAAAAKYGPSPALLGRIDAAKAGLQKSQAVLDLHRSEAHTAA